MNDYYPMTRTVKTLTGSRKKTFGLSATATTESNFSTASYWDGGSRSCYFIKNIITGIESNPPCGEFPFTKRPMTQLKPGEILVMTGTFNGKPATPIIYCLESDAEQVRAYLGLN